LNDGIRVPREVGPGIRKGMGVFDDERGLAESAQAVDGSEDADMVGFDEVFAQKERVGGAAMNALW